MRIIYTIDFSPWSAYSGGAQRSTHNLAQTMSRRGHEVSVVYTKPPWEHVEVPADLPYAVHWATFFDVKSRRRAPLRPLNAFAVARTVRRLLSSEGATGPPPIVHSHGEEGGQLHRLQSDFRFGFVSTPRHPHYPPALLRAVPPPSLTKLRLFFTEGKYLMQGRAVRHADRCVPPSAFAADLVRRAFDVDRERLRVVPNGVSGVFLRAERSPDAEDGPLVFFGRLTKAKGVYTLLDALARLDGDMPRSLIIGRGEEADALARRTERLGLTPHVQFRPWMPQRELAAVLARAFAAVLPSQEESFGNAMAEAMAAAAPVVSTRAGAIPEVVKHGKTGLLVPPGDPDALAEAIRRLQQHPPLAHRLGSAGRRHVRQHLTWDAAAERFEAIYEELLSR